MIRYRQLGVNFINEFNGCTSLTMRFSCAFLEVCRNKWKYLRQAYMDRRAKIMKEKTGSPGFDAVKATAEKWAFYAKLDFLRVVKNVNLE